MEETDVISHLIEVERQAATLLMDAQVEADKRISAAKTKADEKYRSGYEKAVADVEAEFKTAIGQISVKHDEVFSQYIDEVKAVPKNEAAFNELLDNLLFGK